MFTEDELEYISQVYTNCTEDFCELRKGMPQTKYSITIPNTVVWCHKSEDFIDIPKHLVGTWKEKWAGDNTQISLEERLGVRDPHGFKTEWEKCA
tara:strand:- start:19530 stop:19814 length:285 start_codon:yes stop_codon:yes gene_type:complete